MDPSFTRMERTLEADCLSRTVMERHPSPKGRRFARGSVAPCAAMSATAGDTAANLIWEVQRALVTSQQGVGRILRLSRPAVRCAGEVGLTLTELEAGLQPPASAATARAGEGGRRAHGPPKRVTAEPAR
jgi:hypothetical protein